MSGVRVRSLRRGRCGRCGRCGRAFAWCCLALAALWAARASLSTPEGEPPSAASTALRRFPGVAPHTLAHLLADFSLLPHSPDPDPGSWLVEEERANLTEWRYRVSWRCGARCSGRAAVSARAEPSARAPLSRAHAAAHSVTLHLSACTRSFLPPHSPYCDETDIWWSVSADESGAVVEERARARCGGGGGGGGAECRAALDAQRARHWARLALALPVAARAA